MKIRKENNLVEFTPENDAETEALGELWGVIVDCAKFNKKLVPTGEYVPTKENIARFTVEE